MIAEIIYPIVITLQIKKSKFKNRMLVMEADRISYFEINESIRKIFETPIEDCEIFEKDSNESNYELHLISISKSFSERILKHKNLDILKNLKYQIEKSINRIKPTSNKNVLFHFHVSKRDVNEEGLLNDTDIKHDNLVVKRNSFDDESEEKKLKARVLPIISLFFENFNYNQVKIETSNLHFLKEKLYNSKVENSKKNLNELKISTKKNFSDYRFYILIFTLIYILLLLIKGNFLLILIMIPLNIYSNQKGIKDMLFDFIPPSIKDIVNKSRKSEIIFNNNYYLKSSQIVKVNILTLYNYLIDIDNDIYWKKYLIEVCESNSKYNYTYSDYSENFTTENFSRKTTIFDNSMIIMDFNQIDILNIIILESNNNGDFTKIYFYTLLNNAMNITYFKSSLSSLKNFLSFLKNKLNAHVLNTKKNDDLIDRDE